MVKKSQVNYYLYRRYRDESIHLIRQGYSEEKFLRTRGSTINYYLQASFIAGARHNHQLFLKLITRGVRSNVVTLDHVDMLLDAYWNGWNKHLRHIIKRTKAQRKAYIARLRKHIQA